MFNGTPFSTRAAALTTTIAAALCLLILLITTDIGTSQAAGSHASSGAVPQPSAAVGYQRAKSILLKKVIKPKSLAAGDDLIAFRMKRPLAAKTKIHVHEDREAVITVRERSWFFWVDDDPKAQFEHATRYVLISQRTGKVKTVTRNWWPEIKGKAPWFEYAAYWKKSNWAYSTLTPPATTSRAPNIRTAKASITRDTALRIAASTTECAVLIDGSGDKKAGFPDDVDGMEKVMGTTFGYTTKKLTPPNNKKADFEKAVNDLIADGCKDVLLFISGHGSKESVEMGEGATYSPKELKDLIDKNPTVGFKVVVQSCKSGSWITPLGEGPLITITSTDSDKPSYSADPDGKDDPNPGDTGSEFTSGLIEDLAAIPGDPALLQRVQNCVLAGKSILVCKLQIAWESALAKDEDAKAGNENPQKKEK
ncbi:MAG: hypothetical protein HY827_10580 [Actinobacteria bacterium]|nr:hypothetical protein [Actinomycetota bacterium]